MNKDFADKLKLIFIPCRCNKYCPKFLRSKFLFYYAVVLLVLKLVLIPFLFYLPNTVFFADLTKVNLIELANAARQSCGFQALNENPVLSQAAYLKAKDMIEKGYFAHYSPEGITPWYWLEKSGYAYSSAGENLAIGFSESEQVHLAWMNSPSHKKNIMNPNYREIGIAVLKGNFQGSQTALVVQYFGNPSTMVQEEKAVLPAAKAGEKPAEEFVEEVGEAEAEEEVVVSAIVDGPKEVISAATGQEVKKTPAFLLFQFMTSDYYNLIQKIVYGSLALIIISLFIAVFCDLFIYRRFELQYKDVAFKAFSFSLLWFTLFYLDKMIMIQLVSSQSFRIF